MDHEEYVPGDVVDFSEYDRIAGQVAMTGLRSELALRCISAHPARTGWLPATGIGYRWDERLGGRRRLAADSPDTWWQVDAFRAYAAHTRTAEFCDAVDDLIADMRAGPTAAMCSEALWWRCHRRLIADHLTAVRGCTVCHLDHRGRLTDHRVAAGARLPSPGELVYDGP